MYWRMYSLPECRFSERCWKLEAFWDIRMRRTDKLTRIFRRVSGYCLCFKVKQSKPRNDVVRLLGPEDDCTTLLRSPGRWFFSVDTALRSRRRNVNYFTDNTSRKILGFILGFVVLMLSVEELKEIKWKIGRGFMFPAQLLNIVFFFTGWKVRESNPGKWNFPRLPHRGRRPPSLL